MPAISSDAGRGFYAYPWSLYKPADDLARMQDMGMTHLSVAASYHAGKFIQPHDPVARVYFPEDGTVYFRGQGAPASYGRLRPRVAAVTKARDVLGELCEAGTLPVRAWIVLNHNSRLGWQFPECVARNAWGDPYFYSLCPAHPEVRAYAIALCTDLAASLAVASLLLETPGWLTYAHGYHHEFAQIAVPAEAERLMGLCFCASCRAGAKAADIDIDRLRAQVRGAVDTALETGIDIAAGAVDTALLDRFHRWRGGVVAALIADIRASVRVGVAVRIISTCQRPHATAHWEGGDLRAMSEAADGLELPIYQPNAAAAEADLRFVLDRVGSDRSLPSVILRPGHPDMTSYEQLATTVARMTANGIADVSFYNWGMLPARQLGWVERAVREAGQGRVNG